jgi:pimeloyl-ACP methyl ester carboxylesterase
MSAMTESAAPSFRRVTFAVPGGTIAGIALGLETPSPDIVFLHATGFNALTYRAMLQPLAERLHVLAIDARGHGLTTLPARRFGYTSWRRHRDDVIALLEQHCTAPVTLAGHSMGGTVALLAAAKRPDLISSLALIEPVIAPAQFYALIELPLGPMIAGWLFPLARNAAKRAARFPDRETALRAFTGRGVFKSFSPEMLEDYLTDGLTEDARGGLRLSCSPAYEGATFTAQRHDPWGALRRVSCPLVLLRGSERSTIAQAAMHRLAALKPEARVATVEGAGHMLPMERPDRARAAIESAALMAPHRRRDLD